MNKRTKLEASEIADLARRIVTHEKIDMVPARTAVAFPDGNVW